VTPASLATRSASAGVTARGFVKFDGCTQVYFPPGPVHYDNKDELRGLLDAVCHAQERCYEIMLTNEDV
jgi:hypothetical protein